jgi:hypothetical protein
MENGNDRSMNLVTGIIGIGTGTLGSENVYATN